MTDEEGFLLTVEGIDGSGKSTLVGAIDEHYNGWTVQTAEPSTLWTGQQVRRAIANDTEDVHPLVTFYLFMADRVNHIETRIKPALEDGHLVVSDRYADSTMAYQPVALADHLEHPQEHMGYVMEEWALEPDLTVYVDISVDTALERMDGTEEYEQREFLERVRSNYLDIVDRDENRIVVVDGEQPPEAVAADTLEELERRYG